MLPATFNTLASILALSLAFSAVGGRSVNMHAHTQWAGSLILQLPDGWRKLESSEFPVSDMQQWWTLNPIVLEGSDARRMVACNPDFGRPNKVLAVGYMYKDDYGTLVALFGLQYGSQRQAEAQYRKMREKGLDLGNKEVAALGVSAHDPATVFVMIFEPPIPDREYFDDYFRHITAEQYIPPKGGEYVEKEKPKEAPQEAWAWARKYEIARQTLPEGWRLMVKSELPPDSSFPFWEKNPIVVERETIVRWGRLGFFRTNGSFTNAIRIAAVGYKYGPPERLDDHPRPYIMIVALQYKDEHEVAQEIDALKRNRPFRFFDYGLVSRTDGKTIVFMRAERQPPNLGSFNDYFRSVTVAPEE